MNQRFAVVIILCLLTACGKQSTETTRPALPPAKPPVASVPAFIYGRGADSQKLDPADIEDGESVKVLNNICEGLVCFKMGTAEIEPCLATSWTISPDGLTYTFKLRQGVRFHDGTPLDATAAAFSFHRQMDKEHPAHVKDGAFAYWTAMYSMVRSVTPLDAGTLQFKLSEPHAPFLANLAIFPAALISPKFIDQRHPVGTGPFRFVDWTPRETIVLEANKDYWDGAPHLQKLIFKVVPDSAARLIQLQTGQIHAMDGVDPGELNVIKGDKALQLITAPGLNVAYLAFNCEKPPFDDKKLRHAIGNAIDKHDFITGVYRGEAVAAKNPLPPFIPGHNDDIASKTMFLPNVKLPSRPLRLEVMTNPRQYLPNPIRAAELIKADCEKEGIKIEIVPNDWGTHLSRTSHGEHEMALMGWVGDNGDADNFLYVLLDKDTATLGSALNICFWKNDAYHDLMMAARREIDPVVRATIYRKAQLIIADEAPMIPLAHAKFLLACRANVTGLQVAFNGDVFFHDTTFTAAPGTP